MDGCDSETCAAVALRLGGLLAERVFRNRVPEVHVPAAIKSLHVTELLRLESVPLVRVLTLTPRKLAIRVYHYTWAGN